MGEAHWVLHHMEKNLGGSPEQSLEKYIEYSPFVYTDKEKKQNRAL